MERALVHFSDNLHALLLETMSLKLPMSSSCRDIQAVCRSMASMSYTDCSSLFHS